MNRVDYESWILQDILNAFDRKELNLTPWYQRRAVWTRPQQAFLINTIHENKPVPSIYVRHQIDLDSEQTIKEVVDGQQRIRCVLEYRQGAFAARHPMHKKPVSYAELSKSERVAFLQTALSVGYLINASDGDVIEIFARINSVAKTLNPQEKRNSQYGGAFKQFCLSESIERLPFWRENAIFTDGAISRMAEVQFISDLVMNLCGGLQDFSATRLNDFYAKHETDFLPAQDIKSRLERVFSILLTLSPGLLKRTVFSLPQVLFSAMLVLDGLPQAPSVTSLEQCISDIDARIDAVRTAQNPSAMTTDVYAAFTTGNMHRIRARRLRRDAIARYLR
jgi:hypothetical protein